MSGKIDINDYCDKIQQSLIWILQGFHESCITPEQPNVDFFLSEKINDLTTLLEITDCDLNKICDVQFEGITEQIRKTAYYYKIFCAEFDNACNLCTRCGSKANILSQLMYDHDIENLLCEIALHNTIENHNRRLGHLLHVHLQLFLLDKLIENTSVYEERHMFIQDMQEKIAIIETSIKGILIDYKQQTCSEDCAAIYASCSAVFVLLKNMQNIASVENFLAGHNELNTDIYALSKSVYKQAVNELLSHIDLIKIQTILLTMIESPVYTSSDKKTATSLLVIFRQILQDCRIIRLIFDYDLDQAPVYSPHASTKLEIFFSLPNFDQYCLRIDFPHDNYQYVHYNLHEPKIDSDRSTGFPLKYEDKDKLIELCGSESVMNELFYKYNNCYWFRNDFIKKLHIGNVSNVFELEQLFSAQSHYRIINDYDFDPESSPQRMLSFLSAFYEWIVTMNLNSYTQESIRRIEIGAIFNDNYIHMFCGQLLESIFYLQLISQDASPKELEAHRNMLIRTIETSSILSTWFTDTERLSTEEILNICTNHLDSF